MSARRLLVIVDGMLDGADDGFRPLDGLPTLAALRREGGWGTLDTAPAGFSVDSLSCVSTLLGQTPYNIPVGRAFAECVASGVAVDMDALCLRCNIVRVEAGVIASANCPELGEADKSLAGALMAGFPGVEAHHMGAYKYLLVLPGARAGYSMLSTSAPHESLGTPFEDVLPMGGGTGQELAAFTQESRAVLSETLGGDYALVPWGQSIATGMPSFRDIHGFSAAMVAKTEIVAGIGKMMGMAVRTPPGATADIDTDLSQKAAWALEAASEHEICVLHMNGADEASHRLDPGQKKGFLEKVDSQVIAVLAEAKGTTMLVVGDHATSPLTGRHIATPQPFVLAGGGVKKGSLGAFEGIKAVEILMRGGF
jgi:2,3-bisphosphoglycerate-independent phosphoglycerate mutase